MTLRRSASTTTGMVFRLNQTSTPFNMTTPLNLNFTMKEVGANGQPDSSGIKLGGWEIVAIVAGFLASIVLFIIATTSLRLWFSAQFSRFANLFRRKGKQPILPISNTPQSQPQWQ
jgi:hypothetical protein